MSRKRVGEGGEERSRGTLFGWYRDIRLLEGLLFCWGIDFFGDTVLLELSSIYCVDDVF